MTGQNQKFVNLSARERNGLQYFSSQMRKNLKNHIVKISLYGSKARGEANQYSDTDVLVVLKRMSDKDKVYDLKVKVLQKYGFLLSVHIMSEKEYQYERSLPSLFMQFINQEAVEL